MKHIIYFDTAEGILENIAELTGVSEEDIEAFIDSMKDWSQTERDSRRVWRLFEETFRCKPEIRSAIWFHGCRCLPDTTFENGLLPNDQALPEIWRQLWVIIGKKVGSPNPEDLRMRFESHGDSLSGGGYRSRLTYQRQKGPWGKLVREEWFLEGTNSNHYHESGPELICFPLRHFSPDGSLEKLYLERTRGCLVHFRAPCQSPKLIGHGLNFLRDIRFCKHPVETIGYYGLESMEGRAIPSEDILKVEFLPKTNSETSPQEKISSPKIGTELYGGFRFPEREP